MEENEIAQRGDPARVTRRGFLEVTAAVAAGTSLGAAAAPLGAVARTTEQGHAPRLATRAPKRAIAPITQAVGAHPLDPLTANEIATAFSVIEASPSFPNGGYFPTVKLKEPPKSDVLAWSPGMPFRRWAFANVFDPTRNQLFEVVVDLRAHSIVSWVARPGVQPAVYLSEYSQADAIVRADDRWQKAVKRRGINPDDVYLDVWAPGDATQPGVKAGTRLLRALSFFRGALPNPYDRPIEGIVVTVDMNASKVVDVADTGIRPVNKTTSGNAAMTRTGLQPLIVTQPNGPSFSLDGYAVTWQNWHFRVGYSPREGLVLHQVGYEWNGSVRPIIFRMSLDEIFVPYALPDSNWVWRAALDVGEYNLGQFAESLQMQVDVPTNAVFIDAVTPSDTGSSGGPLALPHAIALYERDAGSLWDRTDPSSLQRDARFARELVVMAAYAIGNYTYNTSYVFRMDGGMDVRVGATGTTLNEGVRTLSEGEGFGSAVARNIAAPSHQHFFNFRIDFDVDGTRNRLLEENTHSVGSQFWNSFVTDRAVVPTEQFRDFAPGRQWVVESTSNTNALGEPTAYEIVPIDTAAPYARPSYPPLQHAQFVQHGLWVSQYRDGELYAAGDYPNQGQPGQGVPQYVADHDSIQGTDLVVWYTTGFTHVPTVEEYPVMTSESIGFSLRPNGFFNQNPALDAP